MLGTFFPWKAKTLVVWGLRPVVPSGGGICRCKCSCCLSFVVVIFVNSPATISIMSVTGISLISYWGPMSFGSRRCRRDSDLVCEKGLDWSVAKLWICDRLFTFIRRGEAAMDSTGDLRGFTGKV
jgi:hypothetical protein